MITWNPDMVAFQLGPIAIRWYGLCWSLGIIAAYIVVQRLYKHQRIEDEKFDPLLIYAFLGIILGARLGHCLLYEPAYYLTHPIEMLLPIKQDGTGGWHMVGYAGLASHGGTLGLMIALWLYVRKTKISLMRVLDNIAIATPITAFAIRMGNLMNSEIVGKYTNSDFGFIFVRNGDTLPRHPGQLYEAIAYLLFFFVGLILYKKMPQRVGRGFYFGWCLTSIFTFRFFVEFVKEVQEPWELSMQSAIGLNQGQLLSIPFIIIGLYCILNGRLCQKLGDNGYFPNGRDLIKKAGGFID